MKNATTKESMLTVGLDLGDRYIQVCVLDEPGEVLEESRIPTKAAALERRFGGAEPLHLVLEAGTHSPWVSRLLEGLGHEVLVANRRKLRLIYQNKTKNDRVDAEYLARVGRLDPSLLAPLRHRSAESQKDLALLRSRNALVRARTRLMNHRPLGRRPHTGTRQLCHRNTGRAHDPVHDAAAPPAVGGPRQHAANQARPRTGRSRRRGCSRRHRRVRRQAARASQEIAHLGSGGGDVAACVPAQKPPSRGHARPLQVRGGDAQGLPADDSGRVAWLWWKERGAWMAVALEEGSQEADLAAILAWLKTWRWLPEENRPADVQGDE